MRAAVLIGAVALLAGCSGGRPASSSGAATPPSVAACDAAKAGEIVGKAGTPALAEAARKAAGAQAVRTITPDAMVTMDFRPDRLNVTVDDKGVVTAIRCG